MSGRQIDPATLVRAAGVLLGGAVGDALGSRYAGGCGLPAGAEPDMGAGAEAGAAGSWTDDTAMTVVIADAAATGDLRESGVQDRVAAGWASWAAATSDIGAQTARVLAAAAEVAGRAGEPAPRAHHLRAAAVGLHRDTGRTAGNGSLMRTAPVALAYLGDAQAVVEAAGELSLLTHPDPDAVEACILWSTAIRHTVLTGELDAQLGLAALETSARDRWWRRLVEAEREPPTAFAHNGWVVHALQAAWSAIMSTPVTVYDPERHFVDALATVVRAGGDTDTVAAIAGGLLGACHGVDAVPDEWVSLVHGWPGRTGADLIEQAQSLARTSWAEDPDAELFALPD